MFMDPKATSGLVICWDREDSSLLQAHGVEQESRTQLSCALGSWLLSARVCCK